jgi:DNA-binding PadR family transcriptional regulator
MERELLLLGLLRQTEMHGYQINEFIDAHLGSSINLTRPTAYRLLQNMTERGWVSFREEKVGKRPTRRIYAITENGEAQFREILKTCISQYELADSASSIYLAFLDALPLKEALPLLEKQRQTVAELLARMKSDHSHHGVFQLTIDHQITHLETDLQWLSEIISHLENSELDMVGGNNHPLSKEP